MSQVSVRFFDDETMEGEARQLSFDEPDFLLEPSNVSGLENNETAWIPMTSVKWVEFERSRSSANGDRRKIAIRFLDGEVLRGYVRAMDRHRYGVVLDFEPEEGGEQHRYGIPFSAIKALFYLRQFDGRAAEDQGVPSDAYLARRTMAPLVDVLEEMDMLQNLHEGGVLSDAEYQAKRTEVLERL